MRLRSQSHDRIVYPKRHKWSRPCSRNEKHSQVHIMNYISNATPVRTPRSESACTCRFSYECEFHLIIFLAVRMYKCIHMYIHLHRYSNAKADVVASLYSYFMENLGWWSPHGAERIRVKNCQTWWDLFPSVRNSAAKYVTTKAVNYEQDKTIQMSLGEPTTLFHHELNALQSQKNMLHHECFDHDRFSFDHAPQISSASEDDVERKQGRRRGCTEGRRRGCTEGRGRGCTEGRGRGCTEGGDTYHIFDALAIDKRAIFCL